MSAIGAIDVGSNAIRLVVASVHDDGQYTLLESLRAPVRLGGDVFSQGVISEASIENTALTFEKFSTILDKHGVGTVRAVATSATREAANRDIFIDRIGQRSGIELVTITSDEEARLIFRAIQARIDLKKKKCLTIDIGGGSVEFTSSKGDTIIETRGYSIGTVRLLNVLGLKSIGQGKLIQLINEYIDPVITRARSEIDYSGTEMFIATGGNVEELTDLKATILGKDPNNNLTAGELSVISKKLQSLSYSERIRRLGLRPDRADVIIPATIILERVLLDSGCKMIHIPKVGVKDGLLIDLAEEVEGRGHGNPREQVVSSALRIGRKYAFDEAHALTVARHASNLFDQTLSLHGLPPEYRLLLEVSGLLHDIGSFISLADHHKHTMYLLLSNPVVGLTQQQIKLVANIARYHRKSMPKQQHVQYQALLPKDRAIVSKLASLLRLADALDHEHGGRVRNFAVEGVHPNLNIHLEGEGDMLLEKWSLLRKSEMFEKVFGVKFTIIK